MPKETGQKTVCVVGAGLSGIASLKECVRHDLEPTCYELDSDIGGLWKDIKPEGSQNTATLWEGLVTNASKHNMCFSDFPPDLTDPIYLPWRRFRDYLHRAAKHYDVEKHIRFNTRVMKIRKNSDYERTGRWEVFTCSSKDDVAGSFRPGPRNDGEDVLTKCQRHVYDYVIICCGYYRMPVYPDIPGMETFKGTQTHSYFFKDPSAFQGKHVLIVGGKFSAGDIANSLSSYTKKIYMAVGNGTWFIPRLFRDGRPIDFQFPRSLIYSDEPEVHFNDMMINEAQSRLDHWSSGIRPDGPPSREPWSMGDGLQVGIASGQIQVHGEVVSFGERKAFLGDGSVIGNLDAVIFCTGYKPELSFLDLEVVQANGKMDLFKLVFPLNQRHNTLGFVGHFGTDSPVSPPNECQARMCAIVFSGQHRLPSQAKMKEDAEFWNKATYKAKRNFGCYFVPGLLLADSIASECGFYPTFWKVFVRDPRLAWRTWYGPFLVFQYRLVGPGSDWREARRICYHQVEEGNSSLKHRPVHDRSMRRPDLEEARQRYNRKCFTVLASCSSLLLLVLAMKKSASK